MSLAMHLVPLAVVIAAGLLLAAGVQVLRGKPHEARLTAIAGAYGLFCAALGYAIAA